MLGLDSQAPFGLRRAHSCDTATSDVTRAPKDGLFFFWVARWRWKGFPGLGSLQGHFVLADVLRRFQNFRDCAAIRLLSLWRLFFSFAAVFVNFARMSAR